MANHLIVFGFAWILVSSIMGALLAVSRKSAVDELEQLASENKFADYMKKDWDYRWSKSRHAHSILFSMLCVLTGLALYALPAGSSSLITAVVILMTSAVVLWTFASARHIEPLMGIADLMLFSGVALTGWLMFTELPAS
jgi:hypothetical protein